MKTYRFKLAATAVLCTVLAACGQAPKNNQSASIATSGPASAAPRGSAPALSGQRTAFSNVDSYKSDVAQHIMRHNTEHTFGGALPPMLPAIVVLRITVDETGKVTKAIVQRSRDDDASKVALASMQRAGYLPRPHNLATESGRSLTFSETFLFNADYRFQLRTLAPVQ